MTTKLSEPRRAVITGCSDGGMGAALAIAFHNAGLRVYATARDPAKMQQLHSLGIETLTLDVQSESSIAACVSKVPALDILVNNAGNHFPMPVVDINIAEAKKVYDLNVWSPIAVTQAFLPLLSKSPAALLVYHTSVAGVAPIPFQGVYNSSKSALAMLSDTLRLELQPFGIKVVDLKTGMVKTNLIKNTQESKKPSLPRGSIYEPARDVVDKAMSQEKFEDQGLSAQEWADAVTQDLLKEKPPPVIWKGESASLGWASTFLPFWLFEGLVKKMSGLDIVERIMKS